MIRRITALAVALAAAGTGACSDDTDDCALPGDGPGVDPDGAFCAKLSSYRVFEDLPAQRPAPGLIAYDVATPLFSDFAAKERFIWVPPGAAIGWHASDAFALPVGSVVVKSFSYPLDRRDPDGARRLLETRLLVRGEAGWRGAAYIYDDDAREANRALSGGLLDAAWIHDDGAARTNRYAVPNQNQCKNCHAEHDDTIDLLGPKARQLNRPGPAGSGVANQLQDLIDRGVLTGAPPPASWPRGIDAFDPGSGTVEERARAWLDANCAPCHNARGGAARTSGLYLDHTQTDLHELGLCKPPVAAGRGSGGRAFGIVPGKPDESILVFRIESTEVDIKMPELGRNLVDDRGVALIREWIAGMPGSCP